MPCARAHVNQGVAISSLLLRDEQHSADWDADRNNLCFLDTVEKIAKVEMMMMMSFICSCRNKK
jgi:hypothetical protein